MITPNWGDFVNGVSAKVNEVIDDTRDLTPSFLNSGLFGVVNDPDDLIYRTQGVVGLGYIEEFDENGRIKEDKEYPSYKTEYVNKQKGKNVPISKLLMSTRSQALTDKISEVKQLMIAAQRTMKKHAWQILNNGFSTTNVDAAFPIAKLSDSVSMFSTAHPSLVPGVANRSNRVASNAILTEDNLNTAIQQLREQLNGRGLEVGYEGRVALVVPPAKEKLAMEITGSRLRSDTSNNDMNVFEGKVNVISATYLGNASNGITNANTTWSVHALDAPEDQKSMKFVSLTSPVIETMVDHFTKTINVSVDAAWAMGYSTWEFMVGSDGTGS